jgi:hypothetical protein
MPHTFGTRSERRAFSRDAARHYATTNLRTAATQGPNRATSRKNGQRNGDIAALVHGPHDRAWLLSGTINGGGQARINHKRNQRAEFWRTVRVRVSTEMEPYFRNSLHLLGGGARIYGRHEAPWFEVDLDVHIPGAPADAVRAEPVYWSEYADGRHTPRIDRINWRDADGNHIESTATAG